MLSKNPVETSAYLQRVMEHLPAVVYVFNHEIGQNEFSTKNVSDVLGYRSEEILQLGIDLMTDNVHPDDAKAVFEHIESLRYLADGEQKAIEYRMRHRDGHWVWLLSQDSVFQRNEDGVVTHHIGTAIDITDLKAIAAEPMKLSA